jgi:hypothetical protein
VQIFKNLFVEFDAAANYDPRSYAAQESISDCPENQQPMAAAKETSHRRMVQRGETATNMKGRYGRPVGLSGISPPRCQDRAYRCATKPAIDKKPWMVGRYRRPIARCKPSPGVCT